MALHPARHVVITGAGGGIGRAIARRLDREGASLTLLDLDKSTLEATAASLEEEANSVTCDIRERGKVEKAFAASAESRGPIHALVACAGSPAATVAPRARIGLTT